MPFTKEEFEAYYNDHSISDTAKHFNITLYNAHKFINDNNIPKHTKSENTKIQIKNKGNGYSLHCAEQNKLLIDNLDIEQFKLDYQNMTFQTLFAKYNITRTQFNHIKKAYNLPGRTIFEGQKLSYIEKYGDYRAGVKAKFDKVNEHRDDITKKQKQTKLEKYGDENYCGIEKRKQTCLEKYGDENYSNREQFKTTVRNRPQELIDKINAKVSAGLKKLHQNMTPEEKQVFHSNKKGHRVTDETRKKISDSHKSPEYLEHMQASYSKTCLEKYGVPYYCMTKKCRNSIGQHNIDSKPNINFANKLSYNNIIFDREFPLAEYSYDFIVGKNLIEINPAVSHNSTWGLFDTKGKESNYHMNKSLTAEAAGYRCIHIWDWDDVDKIINLLKPLDKIYARKCVVKNVCIVEAEQFINLYHLQNNIKSDIRMGLYYNDELVSIMTFGKPRYNKKCEYELLRYCSSKNIVGGAEKLFSYFIKTYKPKSIISYCDRSKFTGDVYIKLGFNKLKTAKPSKHWYNIKTERHITDNLLRQRGYDQLFNTNYGKGTSNEQLMLENGFVEIYDSGQQAYVWNNSDG